MGHAVLAAFGDVDHDPRPGLEIFDRGFLTGFGNLGLGIQPDIHVAFGRLHGQHVVVDLGNRPDHVIEPAVREGRGRAYEQHRATQGTSDGGVEPVLH